MRRKLTITALSLLVLGIAASQLAGSAFASRLLYGTSTPGPSVETLAGVGWTPLVLSSSTPALWPGHRASVEVRVTNPAGNKAAVRLLKVAVTVGDAAPGCGSANLTTAGYDGSTTGALVYTVAPGATVTVPVELTMVDSAVNQDACQGHTFPLHYEGSGLPVA